MKESGRNNFTFIELDGYFIYVKMKEKEKLFLFFLQIAYIKDYGIYLNISVISISNDDTFLKMFFLIKKEKKLLGVPTSY